MENDTEKAMVLPGTAAPCPSFPVFLCVNRFLTRYHRISQERGVLPSAALWGRGGREML